MANQPRGLFALLAGSELASPEPSFDQLLWPDPEPNALIGALSIPQRDAFHRLVTASRHHQ